MKHRLHLTLGALAALLLLAGSAGTGNAVTFSIDLGSASPFPPDDILGDPGAPAPAGAVVVIPTGGFAETDAFTFGEYGDVDTSRIFFSVSTGAVGAVGSALSVEPPGEKPADVYSSLGLGSNVQVWDGDGVPAGPNAGANLGLLEPIFLPGDNLDGLDLRSPGPGSSIFWSVDPGTVAGSPPYAGFTPADIFVAPATPGYSGGPFGVYAGLPALGLLPGDDIDALEIIEDGIGGFTAGDTILFSLTIGSPTLGALGALPADILGIGAGIGPAPTVVLPAGALGLVGPSDELDALDLVPEPSRALLLALGFLGLVARRRRA